MGCATSNSNCDVTTTHLLLVHFGPLVQSIYLLLRPVLHHLTLVKKKNKHSILFAPKQDFCPAVTPGK